jgi:hypothetical protein
VANKFEEKKLAFLYQEETSSGEVSRFSKFVSRDCVSELRDWQHRLGKGSQPLKAA